ncbi:Clp protease ClpP, partial [Corynebacterium pyruviciproducens]|nr:Clp protease ClpP [Corynebacterium pyruviciproducens]
VTVKAAAPEESEAEGEPPAKPAPAGPETVTLDMDTYNWLKDAAARGAEAKAKADEADMRAEVDGWVKEGRLHPQNREKAFED